MILLLAPAGWLVGLMYQEIGSRVEGGNNLILEETHDPTSTIPVPMTPLVLIGAVVTHLFRRIRGAGRNGDPDGRVACEPTVRAVSHGAARSPYFTDGRH